jgi:hypothetical protein
MEEYIDKKQITKPEKGMNGGDKVLNRVCRPTRNDVR